MVHAQKPMTETGSVAQVADDKAAAPSSSIAADPSGVPGAAQKRPTPVKYISCLCEMSWLM